MQSANEKVKRKLNHHRNTFKTTLLVLFFVLIIMSLMVSPLFSIRSIEVTGNKLYTKDDIIKMTGINKNNNFFYLMTSDINKNLKKYKKIENSKVDFFFPNAIKINVVENPPIGYICHSSDYIYIDKKGVVIDISKEPPKDTPIITGLEVDEFELGKELKVDNKEIFSNINTLFNVMEKYNLAGNKVMLDLTDKEDIHIYINNLDIKFGQLNQINEKLSKLPEIMKYISDKDIGTLDLSTYIDKIVFSPTE